MTTRKEFKIGEQVWIYRGFTPPYQGCIMEDKGYCWHVFHDGVTESVIDAYLYAHTKDAKLLINEMEECAYFSSCWAKAFKEQWDD